MHPLTGNQIIINHNSPRELRLFLENQGLGMRKKYGQNFLVNSGIREKLLDALELKAGDPVWEIGPGLGAMTKGLLDRGARVTAFEIDSAFSMILRELFEAYGNFTLVEGDVLKTWPKIQWEDKLCLLGNLPYNIAANLLGNFIEKKHLFQKMVITVQREVAQRMMAGSGTKDYSSFTVLCASAYKISPLMHIKGASFYPIPKVDSQGLRLDLLPGQKKTPQLFYPLVRSLFASRRKTIQNNLLNFVSSVMIMNKTMPAQEASAKMASAIKAVVSEALERSGLSGSRRAESLEIEDFFNLAEILMEILSCGQ